MDNLTKEQKAEIERSMRMLGPDLVCDGKLMTNEDMEKADEESRKKIGAQKSSKD